jgi:hypothetical protein
MFFSGWGLELARLLGLSTEFCVETIS